jgi:RNA polymerase sigma-70 factor (ECF subfamily)
VKSLGSIPAADVQSEQDLLDRLRRGEDAAFAQMVRVYGPRLLAVARRFLPNEADALDALQDGFVGACKAIDSFGQTSRLGTWLHAIVVRSCLMKLRSIRRRSNERSIEDLLPRFKVDGHRVDPGPAWSVPSEASAELNETKAIVRGCIDKLPDNYRVVLMLRDIEGFDTAETAKLLGLNDNAVKTRLHRARQALRELLDPYFTGGAL